MTNPFLDRADAGRQLAQALYAYAGRADVVVLVVRKLGVPVNPELAMGAIASGHMVYLQHSVIREMCVTEAQLADVIAHETAELKRREALYRGARPPVPVKGCTVIVVDDGIATGASMRVALQALRERRPARVVVAAPVAPAGVEREFDDLMDRFVAVLHPVSFFGISQFYVNFEQTEDDEVRRLLDEACSIPDGGVSPP